MFTQNGGALSHDIFSGILWTAWGKGARIVLQFAVMVMLARLMTPEEFGTIGAAMIVIGFSDIFAKIGLGPAIVQRPELEPRHLATAFSISLVLSIAIATAIWLISPWIATFFDHPGMESVIKVLTLIFPIRGLGLVAESLAQREMDFRLLANTTTVSMMAGYVIVGVVMAALGFGVWSLVAATLVTAVLRTAMLNFHFPPKGFTPERRAFGELAYFGGGYTLARIANYGALQVDYLVVGHWLGLTALGFYGRAYQLMSVPASTFGQVLDDVLFPSMAKIQDDSRRLGAIYLRGVSLIALVMLPVSVVSYILAPEIVRAVLGWKWAATVLPFQILIIGLLMRTSYKMSDSLTRATGEVYRRAWRQVVYAVLVFAGALVGSYWGIAGVAAGVLAAVTINFVLMAQMSLKLVGETWGNFLRAHTNALLLAVYSGFVTYVCVTILRKMELSSYMTLAVTAAVLALFTVLMLRFAAERFLGTNGIWMFNFLKSYGRSKIAAGAPVEAGETAA
jgi:O-antigen/teichoic acid export membrane protein